MNKSIITSLLAALFVLLLPVLLFSAPNVLEERVSSQKADFRLVQLQDGLHHPWSMAFLPDGSMLVTERRGRLYRFHDGRLEQISGLPSIHAGGQGGLLDLAIHPDFIRNSYIYFTYSVSGRGGAGTALYRARLEGSSLKDGKELYRMPGLSSGGVHFGSRPVFAPDRTLYMTIGDRGERNRAQRLDDAAGKTLRFNDDGTVPEDNPFRNRRNGLPEIYSYGHRNAQGMAVHPQTGRIWQHEHGPRGGDEVNIISPGANYGWPVVSYGEEYRGGSIGTGTSAEGIKDPLIHWTPSIAPSGMSFYFSSVFSGWRGSLFAGALAGTHLRRLEIEGEKVVHQESLLSGRIGRIRDVAEGPEGFLYILTDERNGALYRLEPVQ
jgi:aldose sugar dehydrogenase